MEAVITERGSTMKQMGHLVHLSKSPFQLPAGGPDALACQMR